MSDKKDQDFVSFADAHDDWVRKHTPGPWRRIRGSRLFPPAGASPLNQFLGYLGRVLAVALVSVLGFEILVRSHLKSADFADLVAEETKTLLEAAEVRCFPITWKNRQAFVVSLEGRGSGDSFFDSFRAEGIRFTLPWIMTHRDAWELDSISILSFDVDLGAGPAPAEKKEAAGAENRPARRRKPAEPEEPPEPRYGIHPRLDQLEFGALETDDGNFRWGHPAPFTAGSLRNAEMTLTRAGRDLVFSFASGVLGQNWLQGLRISNLEMRLQTGTLVIDRCEFSLGASGTGTARGKIVTGDEPRVAVSAELRGVKVEDLLPPKYHDHFTGTIDASLVITGSPATEDGIVIEGEATVVDGLLRNLQAFETLTSIYADPRFRRLKLSGGTVAFATGRGFLDVEEFELHSDAFVRLKGRAMIDSGKELFTGVLDLGVAPVALSKHPELVERYFPGDEGGFRWVNTDLQGSIVDVTRELSLALATKVRELNAE